MMNRTRLIVSAITLSLGVLAAVSCNSSSKQEGRMPTGDIVTTTSYERGEAGRVRQDTFTATAKVTAVDKAERRVSLATDDGSKAVYTAGPNVRNFDQIKVGDRVTLTVTQRLVIFVRSGTEDPSATHSAALSRAPKGAKPGVLAGEQYEVVATVTAIDTANRTATLKFVDDSKLVVAVRPDVDLSRYKVGDNVVIRVSSTLEAVVESP